MRKPILVVGDLNADLILSRLNAAPRPGREVLAEACQWTLGGSSGLFASGAGRLGYPVWMAARIGRDETGDRMLKLLRARKVNVSAVRRDSRARTGITVSISHPPDRALITFPGTLADTRLCDLKFPRLNRFAHVHSAGTFLQPALQEGLAELFARARKAGLTTSLDPGWDPRERWALDSILPHVDTLFVNAEEAGHVRGARCLVEKLGAGGSRCGETRAPGFRVAAVDATGAGDTFDAGFVVARLLGRSLQEALALGNACGALSTLAPGGYDGQPTLAQATRLVA